MPAQRVMAHTPALQERQLAKLEARDTSHPGIFYYGSGARALYEDRYCSAA